MPADVCPVCGVSGSNGDQEKHVTCSAVAEATISSEGEQATNRCDSTIKIRAVGSAANWMTRGVHELPPGMSVALDLTRGPLGRRTFHVEKRSVVIGREEGEIQIPDPRISRRHASLEVHDSGTIILRDLSSTNGTYHNNKLIAFCKIQDGDEIRLGTTVLTVSIDTADS